MSKRQSRPPSTLGRGVLAIVLMVGFYALALGLAGALLYVPYAELMYARHLHFKLAAACVLGAGTILWAVLPRIDRFEAPGLLLSASAQPRLFALIRALARETEQEAPAEVYLVADLNAFVTHRGGIMGFGSRRVMGLGLPLMQALSVAELRAVIAHEFGHFHGGDVQLGPWIYKTRGAIVRTMDSLADHTALLQKPFVWYGEMFIKITHAISREQEFAADALAARTVGARPLIGGLRRTHAAALAYNLYWREDLLPALGAGFSPPLAAGFAQFLGAKRAQRLMAESIDRELAHGEADPYDTHPALRERVEAVAGLPDYATVAADDARPATELLTALPALERALLESITDDKSAARALKAISWAEVAQRIHVPAWRSNAAQVSSSFAGRTLATLPRERSFRVALGRIAAGEDARDADTDVLARVGADRIAVVATLALMEQGFSLDAAPGEHVTLARAGHTLCPFQIMLDPERGDRCVGDLSDACAAAGATDLMLGDVAMRAKA